MLELIRLIKYRANSKAPMANAAQQIKWWVINYSEGNII